MSAMSPFLSNVAGLTEPALQIAEAVSNIPHAAQMSAPSSPLKGTTSHEALTQLNRRLDRLSLACQAMWELLRDKAGVTEAELRDKILEVDLRDGSTDGRMASTIVECPHCHAKTNSRRPTCVMCGVEIPRNHQFEV